MPEPPPQENSKHHACRHIRNSEQSTAHQGKQGRCRNCTAAAGSAPFVHSEMPAPVGAGGGRKGLPCGSGSGSGNISFRDRAVDLGAVWALKSFDCRAHPQSPEKHDLVRQWLSKRKIPSARTFRLCALLQPSEICQVPNRPPGP